MIHPQRQLPTRLTHLPPSLPHDIHDLPLIMFLLKRIKLILQKDQTSNVLKDLRFLGFLQIFFAYQRSYMFAFFSGYVTSFADRCAEIALSLFEKCSPA